ncbi:MAG: hypothetical protein D6806_00270 [Deltaproteobacteria bacterium]|nr:MAG: hypothetical protein D6806_00270 [Deltaproteobacteria bacterium]
MSRFAGAMTILAVIACVSGCSSSQPKSCTGDQDCPEGQVCGADGKCSPKVQPDGEAGNEDGGQATDSGDTDSGPKPCQHDRECPPDKVCDLSTGECVAGKPCQESYHCDKGMYCDPDGKTCKTRSQLCEPCTIDEQCPDPGMGDLCIDYPNGKFCGQHCDPAGCPPGYVCDTSAGSGHPGSHGQCRSNTGECGSAFVCHEDSDCASNRVCNKATGKCVAKCQDIGCAAGLVCHATGHCGQACSTDADCSAFGDGLICCTGPGQPSPYCTSDSVGVCRPSGCVLHSECLITTGSSLGYCDKRTGECKTGCRHGSETAGVVSDCKSGYKCECTNGTVSCDSFDCCPDPGSAEDCVCNPEVQSCAGVSVCDDGECIKIPCYERGVVIACAAHNLCCGFPVGDYYPCPSGVAEGDCYVADANTWCASCADEGKACDTPGVGRGAPGVCMKDQKDGNTYCHPSCNTTDDCPATWQCDYAYVQACQDQSNCEATASCEVIVRKTDDNGQVQEIKGCTCQTDADCPTDINGFRAVCEDFTICDYTVDPVDCHPGKVCKFAKACLSQIGCSALHGTK